MRVQGAPPANQPVIAVLRQAAVGGARVRVIPSPLSPDAAARAEPAFVRVCPGELLVARAGETTTPYCVSSSTPTSMKPVYLGVSVLLLLRRRIGCIAGSRFRPTHSYLISRGVW